MTEIYAKLGLAEKAGASMYIWHSLVSFIISEDKWIGDKGLVHPKNACFTFGLSHQMCGVAV